MVEHTRPHVRILEAAAPPGVRVAVAGPLPRPAQLYIVPGLDYSRPIPLLIHFHGAAQLPELAGANTLGNTLTLTVNLGTGTGVYERAFQDPAVLDSLLASVAAAARQASGHDVVLGELRLSAFSAGHGALRALLREPRHFQRLGAILLLDGIHTGYLPEGKVLAEGGVLDTALLLPWRELARASLRGEKAVLITHSEVFPGTFASTTETADWLVASLGLHRRAVLAWGPRGMQQLSEVQQGQLLIQGFAGNSAPDHLDHLHGMTDFLRKLEALRLPPLQWPPPMK
jgi:hypothetical protein